MPPTQTCIVAARGPVALRPGGVPVAPGEIVLEVDVEANASALRRGALKPYDGEIPEDAIQAPRVFLVDGETVEATDAELVAAEAPPRDEPLEAAALQRLTVTALRNLANDRGIDVAGLRLKPDLIERLVTSTTPGGEDQ